MIDKNLLEYINLALKQGKTKEQLYQELLGQGWNVEAINEHFFATQEKTIQKEENTQQKAINAIAIIGSILVGAGVLSFIAANWANMSETIKLVLLQTLMIFSYYGGWILKEKYNRPKTGQALMLLGAIIFGASIFLLGQYFNIRKDWPDAFIYWMLGALATAISLEDFTQYYIALFAAFLAIISEPALLFGQFYMLGSSFIMTSCILLLVAALATFIPGYMLFKKSQLT